MKLPIAAVIERLEYTVILAILVVAGGAWGFMELLDEVSEGESHELDTAILLFFRAPGDTSDPIGPWWLEVAMRDITSLGSMTVLAIITAAVIGFLLISGRRATPLLVLVSVAGGTALSSLLKLGVDRPRPDLVARLVDVHTLSFPSGHAMLSAVTYLTLGALLARVLHGRAVKTYVLAVAVVLTIAIGLSRVYLGVHWPTDVLAGWCAGAAWAMICWLAAVALQRRGSIAPPGEGSGRPAPLTVPEQTPSGGAGRGAA
jgi:undecaprenyl-diphosphatase